jgi:hypothetical protein
MFGQEQTPESLIQYEELYENAYQKSSAGNYSEAAIEYTKCIDWLITNKHALKKEGFNFERGVGLVYFSRGVCYGNLKQMNLYCSDLRKAIGYGYYEAEPYLKINCSN